MPFEQSSQAAHTKVDEKFLMKILGDDRFNTKFLLDFSMTKIF